MTKPTIYAHIVAVEKQEIIQDSHGDRQDFHEVVESISAISLPFNHFHEIHPSANVLDDGWRPAPQPEAQYREKNITQS